MKPTTRVLTAVLLTSMMMLSGCLGTGTGDDTEDDGGGGIIPTAQGSTVTTVRGRKLHPHCKPLKWERPRQHLLGMGKRNDNNNNHVCKWYNHQHD